MTSPSRAAAAFALLKVRSRVDLWPPVAFLLTILVVNQVVSTVLSLLHMFAAPSGLLGQLFAGVLRIAILAALTVPLARGPDQKPLYRDLFRLFAYSTSPFLLLQPLLLAFVVLDVAGAWLGAPESILIPPRIWANASVQMLLNLWQFVIVARVLHVRIGLTRTHAYVALVFPLVITIVALFSLGQ